MKTLSAFETSNILICRRNILEGGKNELAVRYVTALFQSVGNCVRTYFEGEDYDKTSRNAPRNTENN